MTACPRTLEKAGDAHELCSEVWRFAKLGQLGVIQELVFVGRVVFWTVLAARGSFPRKRPRLYPQDIIIHNMRTPAKGPPSLDENHS